MGRKSSQRPTDAELEILQVLWQRGPSTVKEVHEQLSGGQGVGYTTILKLMQIMTEKGLVIRDETSRSHVYAAKLPREQTQRQLVRDLLDRAFGGSARTLIAQALLAGKASPEELDEIRRLLDRIGEDKP
ncbi:MAG: BlaI/MecI/CopY family transcriptional regulator [Phycisphaerae bacterium]|nr:BlaI/MecI/CopY family transcriptional regulator [Phycisphaerae bacterium]